SAASGSSTRRRAWRRPSLTRPRLPTPAGSPALAVTLLSSLRTLVSVGFDLKRLFARHRASSSGEDDSEATALLARAAEVSRAGRSQEAGTLYRQILQTRKSHLGALRGLRDLAAAAGRRAEARAPE